VKRLKYIVTTTRRSNPRTRSLAKELARSLPLALKVNRGKARLTEVIEYARSLGATNVIVVGRGLQGNPGRIGIINLSSGYRTHPSLILKLRGVRLARELGVKPHPPTGIAVAAVDQPSSLELGHELAAALNLPLLEGLESVGSAYESVILVETLASGLQVVRFVSSEGAPRGPRLLVERYLTVVDSVVRGTDNSENSIALGS
jgi:rRNA maturation protein Rpf1